MTTSQRRKNVVTPKRKARKARKKKVKQVSIFDRMLRAMPISEAQVQRGLTWGLVGVFVLAAYAGAHYAGIPQKMGEEIAEYTGNAGFEVKRVEVTGVNRIDKLKIYEITLAQKDRSMITVDIDQVRDDLLQYGWIKEARISRRLPDTLVVDILEREPVAVWQHKGKLSLVDATGYSLETVSRDKLPDLPIILGKKANEKVADLLKLLNVAPALRPAINSASWIGGRRWDLKFDSGEVLALPEGRDTAAAALMNFARMDGVNQLLGRGIVQFDLRDSERAYFRMPPKKPKDRPEG